MYVGYAQRRRLRSRNGAERQCRSARRPQATTIQRSQVDSSSPSHPYCIAFLLAARSPPSSSTSGARRLRANRRRSHHMITALILCCATGGLEEDDHLCVFLSRRPPVELPSMGSWSYSLMFTLQLAPLREEVVMSLAAVRAVIVRGWAVLDSLESAPLRTTSLTW